MTESTAQAPWVWMLVNAGGKMLRRFPGTMLAARYFSIPQLEINTPVVGGDLEIAYLYLDQTGTFQWVCLTPCGFGDMGANGAMSGRLDG